MLISYFCPFFWTSCFRTWGCSAMNVIFVPLLFICFDNNYSTKCFGIYSLIPKNVWIWVSVSSDWWGTDTRSEEGGGRVIPDSQGNIKAGRYTLIPVRHMPIVLTRAVTELMRRQWFIFICPTILSEQFFAFISIFISWKSLIVCSLYVIAFSKWWHRHYSISRGGALVLLFFMRPLLNTLLH